MIKRLLNPHTLLKITLILTTLLLLPTSSWAAGDDYNLVIAGTTVTSSNASDILNDGNGGTGSVSFDGENTLTLNNARITINKKNAIESSLNNLNVYLVGESTITCQGNDDIVFKGTASNANITFSTSSSSYGSLQIQVNSENQLFSGIKPSYPDELSLYNEGYTYTIEATKFNIKVANIDVTAANASNILGGQFQGIVSYDANNNTLTLDNTQIDLTGNGSGTVIEAAGIDYFKDTNFTVKLIGTNSIKTNECEPIRYNGINDNKPTLTFSKESGQSCSLELSSGSTISGFSEVILNEGLYLSCSMPIIYDQSKQTFVDHTGEHINSLTITSLESYPLWIGKYTSDYYQTFTQVTEDNYSDIFGDSKISFDRDHTLTLSGAIITGSIISGLSSLNIIVDKNNSIQIKEDTATCIRNIKPGATLTLKKEQNSDMASLTVQGRSLIRGFNPISYNEGGLKLFAYNRTYQESTPLDLLIPDAYYDYEYNEFRSSSDNIVSYVKFSTEIPIMIGNTPVTRQNPINANDNDNDDILGEVGSVTLSVDANNNNILTIDNLETGGKDIVSTLPNLTIKYKGSCNIGKIISNNSDAALTFGLAEGANDKDKCYFSLSNELPWEGFSGNPTFNNTIVYIPGADSHYITKLKSPDISIEEGIYLTSQDQFEYAGNDAISFYYTIDYVDESKVDVSTPQKYEGFTPDHPFTISDPAILSVYAHYNYMDRELNSGNAIGKYFGFASNTVETTYSEEVKLPTISPTLPESIRPYYMVQEGGNTAGVTFNEETGTIIGYSNIGEATVNVELRYDEYPNFTILNERENDFENLGNFTLTIVPKSLTNDMIQAIADQTYSFGNAITPTVTVKDGETTLTLATTADDTGDYSVTYSNNTNAAKSTDDVAPTVTITGKGNYTGTASKTFTINPMAVATATISLSDATLTYNGAAQHPTISSIEGENSGGSTLEFTSSDYTISYEQNDNTLTADDVKDAGGYTLVAIFGGNYSGTATTTFNIAAKDLSDAATIATIPDQTYTGNEIKPEPAVSIVLIDGNDATTLTKGTDFDYSYANNINASEQAEVPPTVTITGKGNYTGSASQTFSITNATMTVTATGYNGTYDGNAHGITVAAPEGATVTYGTKKGTYDKTESPTYTDAGSYMVHYQVVKTNYATIADSAKVEIMKATPSITFDEESYTATYGAEFTAPTASTNPEGLTVTATSSSNTQVAAVADGVITITGIGETTITVSFAGNNNYEAATTTYKLNVAAGAITGITATGYTGTYDGKAHGITVAAPEGATVTYGTKKGTYDKSESPTYTDAGSYMVHYQVERTNYATITDSAKVEITKATPSITFDKESYSATYGEAFTAPTASTNPEGLTVTATSSSNTQVATISDGVITIVGVGETTITVSFAGSNNYEATTATYKLNVAAGTIIGVTATGYSDVYDGKAHGITVTAPEGATIKYGTKKGTYNLNQSPTYSDAGTYMVHYQVECTNYTTLIDSVKVEITKANITPSITLEGWAYGTTANTPVVTGNTGNGTETFTYKAEGSDAFTSEVPTAVGTHTVKVTIAETTNYNGGEATTTFAITNRTIEPAKDITFAEGQSYASFYSANEDLVLPESGIAVYMITGIEGNTLITQAVSYIPKGVPVLIEKTETAVEAKDPSEVGTNMLQYATEDVAASGTLYILYNGEYVKATGTIPQGKCYLKLNKPSGARILTIGNNNGTTSISNFNADTETDRWFDLNGQRISKPQKKGLYIKNGKKIVVK